MASEGGRHRTGYKSSPWFIIGAAIIMLVVVLAGAVQNTRREKRHMQQVLTTKGAALIRGVEAGTRTGMMGLMWGGAQVQRLLEETAQLPDVLYMAIIDLDGMVLAHSDATHIGKPFRPNHKVVHLGPERQENWDVVDLEGGRQVFEVHRYFKPLPANWGRGSRQMGAMMRQHITPNPGFDWFNPQSRTPKLIVVGLDMTPFQQSMANDLRQTVVLSGALILLGFAGMVSLYWMQSYRAARKSMQDTSAVAENMVAHLPVGLIATDSNGRIAFFNASAARLTGLDQQQAMGYAADDVLPVQLGGLEVFRDDGPVVMEKELAYRGKGLRPVPVSIIAAKIIGEENRSLGHILILRDLGEVRRLQDEVRRQEKLAALGGLAAGVAHEIRNPLSSIKGLATYFAGKFPEDSEDRRVANVMTNEVDRLNRVISELLEFARPTDVKPQPTDISALIRHSLRLVEQDAAARHVEVVPRLDDSVGMAEIDPDRLSQCLLNLYLNAFDAMPSGGLLTVASFNAGDGQFAIEIADTGCGMDVRDLEKIFNPYFTSKPKGTGLGLAIVHKIITAHGGQVRVDSLPGKGTRFEIRMGCRFEAI